MVKRSSVCEALSTTQRRAAVDAFPGSLRRHGIAPAPHLTRDIALLPFSRFSSFSKSSATAAEFSAARLPA